MANFNKQFNFRNGVQVDDDNLVVSSTGLVGIGTTIPTEVLDVRGNAKISGFSSATSTFTDVLTVFNSAEIETINLGTKLVGSGVSIASGIISAADPATGIVTYFGDARFLSGMPTSQWIDVDAGLGFTSIYNRGFVGISTIDPRFDLQIGGSADTTLAGFTTGVGISSVGNVLITGITTSGKFVGVGSELTQLNADNIVSGTITNDRIPVLESSKIPNNISLTGIVTANKFIGNFIEVGVITATSGFTGNITGNVTGNVTGTATTALSLTGSPNIIVGILTANAVAASSFIGGITGDVTGNLSGTATTATSLTSNADVDIADLTVGVATVSSFVGLGTDYLTGSIAIGGNTNSNGNDIYINRAFDRTAAGITTTFVANARIKLWSDIGESTITIGTSESDIGVNGQIKYGNRNLGSFPYSNEESLDFINYGNGSINNYLQAGTVGVDTGSYFWHYKTDVLAALTYEGNLGIGLTNPVHRLSVLGISTFTGDAHFNGNVTIDGSLTPGSIILPDAISANVTGDLTGNVNSQSGLSTFSSIRSSFVGIGTDSPDNDVPEVLSINSPGTGRVFVDQAGNVGVGTTTVHIQGINAQEQDVLIRGVGIGTTSPRCAVDFTDATNSEMLGLNRERIAYMIPPKVTTAQRNNLTNVTDTGVETGAFIYNTDLNKLQVYTGSSWETVTSS